MKYRENFQTLLGTWIAGDRSEAQFIIKIFETSFEYRKCRKKLKKKQRMKKTCKYN